MMYFARAARAGLDNVIVSGIRRNGPNSYGRGNNLKCIFEKRYDLPDLFRMQSKLGAAQNILGFAEYVRRNEVDNDTA
jgi:hypothetical protein